MRFAKRLTFAALAAVTILSLTGCGGNIHPNTVVTNVANNATVIVQAVDKIQDFVIEQEAAGRIPRNAAVTTMEHIGSALKAARQAHDYMDTLIQTSPSDLETKTLMGQIQTTLAIVSTEVGMSLIPVNDETVRAQVAKLAGEVANAIAAVNNTLLAIQAERAK